MKCQKTRKQTGADGWRWLDPDKLSIKLSLLGAVTIDLFQTVLSFYRVSQCSVWERRGETQRDPS